MATLVYSQSCATIPINFRTFHHFPKKSLITTSSCSPFPSPQVSSKCSQLWICLLSPKICLFCTFCVNGIIQNVPSCLTSFTYHDVFKFHPCWSMYPYFIAFDVWILFHWKRAWCWGRLRAGGEGGDRGWDGWMASLTQWAWVWANAGRWWRTGKPGVLPSMGLQGLRHDWVTEQQLLHRMDIPHFVYPFIHWWSFEFFHVLAIMKHASMDTCIQVFVWTESQGCFEDQMK